MLFGVNRTFDPVDRKTLVVDLSSVATLAPDLNTPPFGAFCPSMVAVPSSAMRVPTPSLTGAAIAEADMRKRRYFIVSTSWQKARRQEESQ